MKKFFGEESGWGVFKSIGKLVVGLATFVMSIFGVIKAVNKYREDTEEDVELVEVIDNECPDEVMTIYEDEDETEVVDIPTEE